jgi:hypothetical protein
MIKDIHIFSPGVQTSAQGVTREFTANDLQQVAESYEPDVHEAPIRIGHEDNDKVPSWGWVKDVKMKGKDLVAEVEFSPLMEDYVKNGLYKKVSASFYSPESKINPEPGKWSLRHVAMLGAQPPAVKGLKGFAYSEEDAEEGVYSFAVTLTPDQVFDEELGPTLKVDTSPLETLKEKLIEAKSEMTKEEQSKVELEASTEEELEQPGAKQGAEFAEEELKMKKKKVASGDQGAEDAEEEDDDDDEVESKEMEGKDLPDALKENAAKKKAKAKGISKEEAMKEGDADHAGCDGKKSKNYSEIEVPEGMDIAEYKEGFEQAVKAYAEALELGQDIEYEETEDSTPSYEAGIKAGFEFAQADFQEPTFDPINDKGDKKKRGTDNLNSSDVGVKETPKSKIFEASEEEFKEKKKKKAPSADELREEQVKAGGLGFDEEEAEHGEETAPKNGPDGMKGKKKSTREVQNDQSGRGEVGKGEDDDRDKKGTDSGDGRDKKGTDDGDGRGDKGADGEQDKDRKEVGKAGKEGETGRDEEMKPAGGAPGSGAAVKKPQVRVMYVGKKGSAAKQATSNYAEEKTEEVEQFSELEARLAELEAANAKLLSEKIAAEQAAHRVQLEEFAEALYAHGKLTPAVIDQAELVDYMEGLEAGTLQFAEGESAATKLMDLLAALPSQVEFSEVAGGKAADAIPFEELDPHEKALKMSKEDGMSYAEALKQTLFSVE